MVPSHGLTPTVHAFKRWTRRAPLPLRSPRFFSSALKIARYVGKNHRGEDCYEAFGMIFVGKEGRAVTVNRKEWLGWEITAPQDSHGQD